MKTKSLKGMIRLGIANWGFLGSREFLETARMITIEDEQGIAYDMRFILGWFNSNLGEEIEIRIKKSNKL